MNLIDDAKKIALHAWSIRLAVLSAVLSGAEVGIQYLDADALGMPKGVFASLASFIALSAAVSRLVAQPKMHNGADT